MNLYWNDPDPIEGADYRVSKLEHKVDDIYFIHYGDGFSTAEVYAHELEIR